MSRARARVVVMVAIVVCLGVVTACGGSGGRVSPPANPGTAEQLAGSSWEIKGDRLEFQEGGVLVYHRSSGDLMTGTYTVREGIVAGLFSMVEPMTATWDGEVLQVAGAGALKRVQ